MRAVDLLDVRPDERLLEIGCGNGAAVSLVCELLEGGRITAIDSSPIQVERAARRNAGHVAAGKAEIRLAEPQELRPEDGPFDKVFAVNVNVFWTSPARAELARIAQLLGADGSLHLFYEAPSASKANELETRLTETLTAAGFEPAISRDDYVVAVVAHDAQAR